MAKDGGAIAVRSEREWRWLSRHFAKVLQPLKDLKLA
jgi:hypothetical protein